MAGDPGYVGKDLARYAQLTPAAVSAATAQWLRKDSRVVVQAKPGEQVLAPEVATPPPPSKAAQGEREALNAPEPWRNKPPGAAKAKPLSAAGRARASRWPMA